MLGKAHNHLQTSEHILRINLPGFVVSKSDRESISAQASFVITSTVKLLVFLGSRNSNHISKTIPSILNPTYPSFIQKLLIQKTTSLDSTKYCPLFEERGSIFEVNWALVTMHNTTEGQNGGKRKRGGAFSPTLEPSLTESTSTRATRNEDTKGATVKGDDASAKERTCVNPSHTCNQQQQQQQQQQHSQSPSNMAEPPAKRARRTDSAAMWERNEASLSPRAPDSKGTPDFDRRGNGDKKVGTYDHNDRRRSKSRDRERYDRRHDRSRSRDKSYRDRDRDRRDRDGRESYNKRDRDRRDGERSRSRDRPGSKRGIDMLSFSYMATPLTYADAPIKRERDRSRSPVRNGTSTRTRSPPRGPRADRMRHDHDDERGRGYPDGRKILHTGTENRNGDSVHPDSNGTPPEDEDEDAQLQRLMGFTSFNTTHDKKVPGNNVSGVRRDKKTQYRQYMNRVGGFNRPLSPSRE